MKAGFYWDFFHKNESLRVFSEPFISLTFMISESWDF